MNLPPTFTAAQTDAFTKLADAYNASAKTTLDGPEFAELMLTNAANAQIAADFKATGSSIMAAAALLSDSDLAAAIPQIQEVISKYQPAV